MGKYSLVATYGDELTYIKLKEIDKNNKLSYKIKVNLSTIDKLTTNFKNMDSFVAYLLEEQELDYLPQYIYIEYNYNGVKKLPLVFNNSYIKHFSNISDTKIPTNDKLFLKFVDEFILNVKKDKTILQDNTLNLHLKDKINDFYNNSINRASTYDNRKFLLGKIITDLSNYKQTRAILTRNLKINRYYKHETYNELTELDEEILSLYNTSGIEGIYDIYGLDKLDKISDDVKKLIKLK